MTGIAAFEADLAFLGEGKKSIKFFFDSGSKRRLGFCRLWVMARGGSGGVVTACNGLREN